MPDKMTPLPFDKTLDWIFEEYKNSKSIFGISTHQFTVPKNYGLKLFGENLSSPIGPAAGPHTQMTHNIIAAFLTGGRFFELKTVQILDELEIEKPCILAQDEGYNVEWSQELKIEESLDEYLKAWIILNFFDAVLSKSKSSQRSFIFNMSVGYNLEGIKSDRIDNFIESMKDASLNEQFHKYKSLLISRLQDSKIANLIKAEFKLEDEQYSSLVEHCRNISPNISNSVTLSTMHGCPPDEISSIAKYLIKEKNLHTYIKLNPTLIGFSKVKSILGELGYSYIELDKRGFEKDLELKDAVPMIKSLQEFAASNNREFGLKLSNTLGVKNTAGFFKSGDMYMSGRSLFPLTIKLAGILSDKLGDDIQFSFSGGANQSNIASILECGIYPVTVVTDLLKPGGYYRLAEMSRSIDISDKIISRVPTKLNKEKIDSLFEKAISEATYRKNDREINSIKTGMKLPLFDCYIAPCQEACPIHQDVAEYANGICNENYDSALVCIMSKNALPNITGYICDHKCMDHCTRWDYEKPVLIRDLKLFAAENSSGVNIDKKNDIKNDVRVAVIGAGPAGLSAAYFLRLQGFAVTIFDKAKNAGGTVQNVIPPFRLPAKAIEKDIEFIKSLGVKLEFSVDPNLTAAELQSSGFKYVFIAIGAGISKAIELAGDNTNVLNALEFLQDYHTGIKLNLRKNVAVVGGGNSAMDGARAAIRCENTEKVYILYRRTKEFMPADMEEFDAAIEDGVIFKELLLPFKWNGKNLKCQKMKLGDIGEDGRRQVVPIDCEFETLEIDTVISAIGEKVDLEFLRSNGIEVNSSGKIVVDPISIETKLPNVFIGGDALRGPATVVEAIADGRKTAEEIIKRENIVSRFTNHNEPLYLDEEDEFKIVKNKGKLSNPVKENLIEEAARCLTCSSLCNKCIDVCPNRANAAIALPGFKDKYQVIHIDGLCNECGNCETFCPYQGMPYKDKPTLFWSEKEFIASKNDGFFITELVGSNLKILVRFENQVSTLNAIKIASTNGIQIENKSKLDEKFVSLISGAIKCYSYLFSPFN